MTKETKAILRQLDKEKLAWKKRIHFANNLIINTSVEMKVEMIEWFENLLDSEVIDQKIEMILIERMEYYKNKNKYSIQMQDTNETVDGLEMIEWFLVLVRKLVK